MMGYGTMLVEMGSSSSVWRILLLVNLAAMENRESCNVYRIIVWHGEYYINKRMTGDNFLLNEKSI